MHTLKKRWQSIVVFVIAIICYSNTFNHGFVLDDDVVYLKNSFVQNGAAGLKDIFTHGFLYGFNQRNDQSYRPLVLANFAIEHQLFGNDPKAHHIIGVLLYSLLCVLIYQFLILLFKNQYRWMAFWVALIYCLHPIHTEVVANIKGRDEILHAIFVILSLMQALKFTDSNNKAHLSYSLIFLFLALLCKEMAVTMLGVVPLILYVFRHLELKKTFLISTYFLIPIVLYFLIRNVILDDLAFEEKMTVINNTLAAAATWQEHIGTATIILLKYIQLLIWPTEFSWDYSTPYFPIHDFSSPKALISFIILLGAIIASTYLVISKRNMISASFLLFVIPFSIVSNYFILIGCTLGERFMFFPSLGFILMVALIFSWVFDQIDGLSDQRKQQWSYLVIVPLLFLSFQTVERNGDWKNNERLFRSAMEVTPNNSRAVAAYASIFRSNAESSNEPNFKYQQFNEAIKWYLESAKLYEDVADTWYNLGVCYLGINKQSEAKQVFEKALNIDASHINALNNLGVIYFQTKDFQNAMVFFEKAIGVNVNFASGHANLGAVHHNLGNFQLARSYYENALRLNPQDQNTRMNLSKLN